MALAAFANVNTTTLSWTVPSGTTHSLSYHASCGSQTFYFVSYAANNGDQNAIFPSNNTSGDTNCQASDANALSVLNAGNVPIDVNLSVVGAFTTGVFLKVWSATGDGCGTEGSGGYEDLCTATGLGDGLWPSSTACTNILGGAGPDVNKEVIGGLAVGDTNGLCFHADFVSVAVGTNTDDMVSDSFAT